MFSFFLWFGMIFWIFNIFYDFLYFLECSLIVFIFIFADFSLFLWCCMIFLFSMMFYDLLYVWFSMIVLIAYGFCDLFIGFNDFIYALLFILLCDVVQFVWWSVWFSVFLNDCLHFKLCYMIFCFDWFSMIFDNVLFSLIVDDFFYDFYYSLR